MKKKKITIILINIFILIIGLVSFSSYKFKENKEITSYIAYYYDGENHNNPPSKEDYVLEEISCDKADAKFDINTWNITLSNIKGKFKCSLSFKKKESDKIYHKLSVDPGDGEYNNSPSITEYEMYEGETKDISNPILQGYTFKEWEIKGKDSNLKDNIFTMGSEDAKLTASYTVNTYKLTISGTNVCDGDYEMNYGETFELCTPKRDGYSFLGWQASSGTIENNIYKIGASNSTISPKWSDLIYSTFVDTLTNLAKTSTELAYDNTIDNNLRYIGADPNNYVTFNGEEWRVVGLMNNIEDANGNKASRVKLSRANSIGKYSFDSSNNENWGRGINEWSQSDIMKLLNDKYEENKDYINSNCNEEYTGSSHALVCNNNEKQLVNNSLYWNKSSGICYNSNQNHTKSCDFTSSGLKDDSKKYIDTVVWHTSSNGEENIYTYNASNFYNAERANNTQYCTSPGYDEFYVQNCTDNVERKTTWIGKVALLYPSDYYYATSGGEDISRDECLNSAVYSSSSENFAWKSTKGCASNNWIISIANYMWFLMPKADSVHKNMMIRLLGGGLYNQVASSENDILPTIYLKPTIRILSGDGSKDNPYKLYYDE